jgi:hypothetical protein
MLEANAEWQMFYQSCVQNLLAGFAGEWNAHPSAS